MVELHTLVSSKDVPLLQQVRSAQEEAYNEALETFLKDGNELERNRNDTYGEVSWALQRFLEYLKKTHPVVPRTTATAASSTIEVTTRHQYCCVGCTDFVVSSKTEPQEFLTISVRDGCKYLNNKVNLTLDVSDILADQAYEIIKCRCTPDGESHRIVQGREYNTCGSSILLFELSRNGLANAKGDGSTIVIPDQHIVMSDNCYQLAAVTWFKGKHHVSAYFTPNHDMALIKDGPEGTKFMPRDILLEKVPTQVNFFCKLCLFSLVCNVQS